MQNASSSRITRKLIWIWTSAVILFLYIPMFAVILASFSTQRYFRFPIQSFTTKWYTKTLESLSVRDLLWTSISVAVLVTVFSRSAGLLRRARICPL